MDTEQRRSRAALAGMLVGALALAGLGVVSAAVFRGPCDGLEGSAPDAAPVTRDVPQVLAPLGVDVAEVERFAEELGLGPVRVATSAAPDVVVAGSSDGVFVLAGTTIRSVDSALGVVASTRRAVGPDATAVTVDGGIAIVDRDAGQVAVLDGDLVQIQSGCGPVPAAGALVAADLTYTVVARGREVELTPVQPGTGWTTTLAAPVTDAAALPATVVLAAGASIEARTARTGDLVWRTDAGPAAAVLAAGEDLVLARGTGSQVVAIDAATGETRWRLDLGADVRDAAAIEGRLLVQTAAGTVVLDTDGAEIARTDALPHAHAVAVSDAYTAWGLAVGDRGAVVMFGPAG